MCEYGIASTNIYNMDKTGFQCGIGGSKRVVVTSGNPAAQFKAQLGSQKWATVIECIGSGGQVLLLLIITKGHTHTVGEQQCMDGIPAMWHFAKSSNGWTSNEIAIQWLKNIFDIETKLSLPSAYCLLIIDGHQLHTSSKFCGALWSQHIIPFLLLPHTMHLMQPLDISIFGPLTGRYRHLVNKAAKHMDMIDKALFASFYAQACSKVLMQSRAQNAFSDCSITLDLSPEKVLARLAGRTADPTCEQLLLARDCCSCIGCSHECHT